jgi:hypothetical protein
VLVGRNWLIWLGAWAERPVLASAWYRPVGPAHLGLEAQHEQGEHLAMAAAMPAWLWPDRLGHVGGEER